MIGTYTDPNVLIAYSDGEIRQEFTLVYAAKIKSGELTIDNESKEAVWVSNADGLRLPLADSQRQRLQDLTLYRECPTTFLSEHAIKFSLNLQRLRDPADFPCLYPLARLGEN